MNFMPNDPKANTHENFGQRNIRVPSQKKDNTTECRRPRGKFLIFFALRLIFLNFRPKD